MWCYKRCSNDSGLWCWDATTQVASHNTRSPSRGQRGVLSLFFEVPTHQGTVNLPPISLRGVGVPNCPLVGSHRPPLPFTVRSRPLLSSLAFYIPLAGSHHLLRLVRASRTHSIPCEPRAPSYTTYPSVCSLYPSARHIAMPSNPTIPR